MQTSDDLRAMADGAAATAQLQRDFETGDFVLTAWHAMILYGAADEVERRRGRPVVLRSLAEDAGLDAA